MQSLRIYSLCDVRLSSCDGLPCPVFSAGNEADAVASAHLGLNQCLQLCDETAGCVIAAAALRHEKSTASKRWQCYHVWIRLSTASPAWCMARNVSLPICVVKDRVLCYPKQSVGFCKHVQRAMCTFLELSALVFVLMLTGPVVAVVDARLLLQPQCCCWPLSFRPGDRELYVAWKRK